MNKKAFVTKDMIERIVKDYPTPFHIYDEKGIRENAQKNTRGGKIDAVFCLSKHRQNLVFYIGRPLNSNIPVRRVLTRQEASLYLCLYKRGRLTGYEVSKQTFFICNQYQLDIPPRRIFQFLLDTFQKNTRGGKIDAVFCLSKHRQNLVFCN